MNVITDVLDLSAEIHGEKEDDGVIDLSQPQDMEG